MGKFQDLYKDLGGRIYVPIDLVAPKKSVPNPAKMNRHLNGNGIMVIPST
jgi:hypothetical protein